MLRGRDISRYYHHQPKEFIWYKPEFMMQKKGAGPRKLEYFANEKIFIQDVAQSIISFYSNEFILTNDTLSFIYRIDKILNFKYLLSILNSKFINCWFKNNFQAGLHIKINQLQQIPISIISLDAQKPFIEKADLMLLLNKELQTEKQNFINTLKEEKHLQKITKRLENFNDLDFEGLKKEIGKQKARFVLGQETNEWREYFNTTKHKVNELQAKINQTDKDIDRMVYELYELTAEEIEIVENASNK